MSHSVVPDVVWPFAKPLHFVMPSPSQARASMRTVMEAWLGAHQQKGLDPPKCQVWGQGLLDGPGQKLGGSVMRKRVH